MPIKINECLSEKKQIKDVIKSGDSSLNVYYSVENVTLEQFRKANEISTVTKNDPGNMESVVNYLLMWQMDWDLTNDKGVRFEPVAAPENRKAGTLYIEDVPCIILTRVALAILEDINGPKESSSTDSQNGSRSEASSETNRPRGTSKSKSRST